MRVPRLVPDEPFPRYAYVPGRSPHPVSEPAGHSFNVPRPRPAPPDPDDWAACRPYLVGIDLFNHGYYWEAHEVWEGLWHACGRTGVTADFLKGLIRLAAAGVKAREGKPEGVRSHAAKARQLFEQVTGRLPGPAPRCLGLALSELMAFASDLVERQEVPTEGDGPVFSFVLRPQPAEGS
jgi:predicted metal-dependent hydrolase